MSTQTKADSTGLALKKAYEDAGEDYTGLAEFSDVSGFLKGSNQYEIKAHKEMRSHCTGLKPNTRVYCRFDGRHIGSYCRMDASHHTNIGTQESQEFGDPLVTDASGVLHFFWKIPNDSSMKFYGYKHLLEVSDVKPPQGDDSYGVSSGKDGATTRCGQFYYSPSNGDGMDHSDLAATSSISLTELTADESKVIVTSSQVEEEVPDFLSQVFTIQGGSRAQGVYLDSVYLWFKKKPNSGNSNVLVQIREVNNGRPSSTVISQSKVVKNADVNISSTAEADKSTRFLFDDDLFLTAGRTYAVTVIPSELGHDYQLWTAKSDEKDIDSAKSAFFVPQFQTLYGSASGNKWTSLPKEALKVVIANRKYDTETTGTVILEDNRLEFLDMELSTMSPRYITTANTGYSLNETVRGECLMGITYTGSAPTVGTVIQNISSKNGHLPTRTLASDIDGTYGQGTIRKIINDDSGNNLLTVKVDAAGTFKPQGNVYNSSGTKIGSANTFSANTVKGIVEFIAPEYGRLRLADSTGTPTLGFKAGEYVRGQSYGATGSVKTVANPNVDELQLRVPYNAPRGSEIKWFIKGTSTAGTLDSSFTKITGGAVTEFDKTLKRIYSRSNRTDSSIQFKAELTNTDENVTPSFIWYDAHANARTARINASSANETLPAGDSDARYISKELTVSNPSGSTPTERINITSHSYLPSSSGIKFFIRAKNNNDSEKLEDKNYTELSLYQSYPKAQSTLGNKSDKVKQYYRISANTDGDNFLGTDNVLRENTANNGVLSYRSGDGSIHHGVDQAQIKVVFTRPDGLGTSYTPEIDFISITSHRAPISIA